MKGENYNNNFYSLLAIDICFIQVLDIYIVSHKKCDTKIFSLAYNSRISWWIVIIFIPAQTEKNTLHYSVVI